MKVISLRISRSVRDVSPSREKFTTAESNLINRPKSPFLNGHYARNMVKKESPWRRWRSFDAN